MSERVVELPRLQPSAEFERTPPQDVAAEMSVLGGMLLSKDAIADVVEVLAGPDFYRPAHQVIFDCILDLYGRGEPADAITVAAELNRTDQLSKMGGAVYLHTLIQSTPTAANAGYYAAIVAEQAVLRRLVEAGTRVVQPVGVATGVSSASALPTPGRAAMTTICPACRPLVSSSRSRIPVGTPRAVPPREAMASSSSIVGCRTSSRRE